MEGTWGEADVSSRATAAAYAKSYQRGDMGSVEENYLRLPAMRSAGGKAKSMSTAARLSKLRFGGNNQFIANASPVAYGIMNNILRPQHDSELEAFGCIECLQPADKIPYLGG